MYVDLHRASRHGQNLRFLASLPVGNGKVAALTGLPTSSLEL